MGACRLREALDAPDKSGQRPDSASDRRAKIVHLTTEGKKLITRAYNAHAADMEQLASELSAAERVTLIRLLKKIGSPSADKRQR